MDWTSIIVAVIAALGSFLGVYFSNRKAASESAALLDYRIGQLEAKVDKHNNVIERTFKLEEQTAVIEERIKVANNRISDLEQKGA